MDGNTMRQIRNVLMTRWKKIGVDQERNTGARDELLTAHAEMIDVAQALEQIGRETSLQEAERRELLAIERALSKMSHGSFGFCEECGEEIPSKRLMVLPEARLCAQCQTFEERLRNRVTGFSR